MELFNCVNGWFIHSLKSDRESEKENPMLWCLFGMSWGIVLCGWENLFLLDRFWAHRDPQVSEMWFLLVEVIYSSSVSNSHWDEAQFQKHCFTDFQWLAQLFPPPRERKKSHPDEHHQSELKYLIVRNWEKLTTRLSPKWYPEETARM